MIRPAVFVEADRLGKGLGIKVILACEMFQRTGSFKFRAAFHVASNVPHTHLIAASSGNFGQALACACLILGKKCTVVMPAGSSSVKLDAVKEHGGVVELVDARVKSRAERVSELAALFPEAYVASAYDDSLVIEGNASLGKEIAACGFSPDAILVPVGGGGLSSGVITGVRRAGKEIPVIGCEPLMANDAARSFREGRIVANEVEPQTIADGARTLSLGEKNWEILREGMAGIIEVPEEKIVEGVRALFLLANVKSEPTGALAVAGILTDRDRFADRTVCCVVSGGNVDPELFASILRGDLANPA